MTLTPSTLWPAFETLIRGIVRDEVDAINRAESPARFRDVIVDDSLRLYSVAAAARILDMSRVWVYQQINRGQLPSVEFGDTRPHQRIRAVDLQSFIDARASGRKTD